MPHDESWSWKKLATGPFNGKNYAKAAVLGLCQLIILCIVGALVFTVVTLRGCQRQRTETTIGTNSGVVNQSDSHSVTTVTNHYYPLSDLFSWVFGSKQKVVKEQTP